MIDDKMMKDKAQVYFDKQIAVHIIKKNGEWLNGLIKEINADFFMLVEFKKEIMPVFFSEIVSIETFTEVGT